MKLFHLVCTILLLFITACSLASATPTPPTQATRRLRITPAAADPNFIATPILSRPTATSVTVNVVLAVALNVAYEYGLTSGVYPTRTTVQAATAGVPLETLITGLQPNTRYYYRILYGGVPGAEASFMTQRAPGSTFSFAIQGDSHPERTKTQFDAQLYTRTLGNAAAEQPDFYMAIGDDFSVDTLNTLSATTVSALYRTQRQWLGLVGSSAPLFLVNGNHEQASQVNLNGTADNVAVWAQNARNTYYSQPAPDGFYTGDTATPAFIGLLRDYYAWTWGDALFVVIDPYWHSPVAVDNLLGGGTNTRDPWGITLGDAQYQWFKQTLEQSSAKYKFVFAHHVNGTGRGGVELANLYEWGGANPRGTWQFATYRPTWASPLHQLMVQHKVTMFVQGHDHLFAKQDLDGVAYLTLPEPANPFYSQENFDAYLSGDKLPNSGHVRVTVAPEGVTVNYIRAYLPKDESATQINGTVAYTATIASASPTVTFPGTVILGRPTATTMTANLLADETVNAYLTYGPQAGGSVTQTAVLALQAGVPATLELTALHADTAYSYQVHVQRAGATAFEVATQHSFHTQRAPGSSFTFTIGADPHNRDTNFNGAVYSQTLQNALADHPDFHLDLGDTFMTEKLQATTVQSVTQTLLDQRPYFGLLGAEVPLFLVNGNHEGELGWLLNGTANNLAIWSTQARQRYYPNPTPGTFYSGSTTAEPLIGLRDGYYAWTWGDALFVVLDPFWYTTSKPKPGGDGWEWTLGQAQYTWLKQTLETSQAKFKFVFAHQLVGGSSDAYGIGRGGIEFANLYEWGGANLDGSAGFVTQRPGWALPIHQLLVANHVNIFFHGHDHLYVQQELDGVVYQEVPQPSNRGYDTTTSAADYGYLNGTILGNSGHLRVTVTPTIITVAYVRAFLTQDLNTKRQNGMVSASYTLGSGQGTQVYLPLIVQK